MTPEMTQMIPERVLAPLPQRSSPASEYSSHGGWNFEIGGAEPRIKNTAQSLFQLLVDPQSWVVEAYKIQEDAWNRKGHFNFRYVFYSPSRERAKFSARKLDLNLKEVTKPEVFDQYYKGGATDVKGVSHRWVNLRPPFAVVADPENPTSQYLVDGVTLRDFNLYLKHKVEKHGGEVFDQPVFDPRRFVAEVSLEDPIVVFKSQILDGLRLKSLGDIDRFIEQNRNKVPPELMAKVEAMFAAIKDQQEELMTDLS